MRRLFLCVLLSYGGMAAAQDMAGQVWLGFDKAKCGGILIEPDIVLSVKSCIKSSFEVLWPFKSGISLPRYESENADLVVLFLERSWLENTRLIHTSELSNLKKGLRVHFSNKHYSTQNWIDNLEPSIITAFRGLEHPLIGSPMWSDFGVVGMMTGEKTALRLDPYFAFIAAAIKTGREKRPKMPITNATTIVIEAQHAEIKSSAETPPSVSAPAPPSPPSTRARNDDSVPESLGCSCSQVRRRSSSTRSWRIFF